MGALLTDNLRSEESVYSAACCKLTKSGGTYTKTARLKTKCGAGRGNLIPTVFKGIVKITPILAKCNIDAGLPTIFPRSIKNSFGRFRVIWGASGRGFNRKS